MLGTTHIKRQVVRARADGPRLIELAIKRSVDLRDAVRTFYREFIAEQNEWWRAIFADGGRPVLGYYRKDSYLLSDAPFLLRPTTALVFPSLNPTYYGVRRKGLESLDEGGFTWFTAQHHSCYPKLSKCEGEQFLDTLVQRQHSPLYTDALEDALAAFWVKNVADTTKIAPAVFGHYRHALPDPKFKDFLQEFAGNAFPTLRARVADLPKTEVPIGAGLVYANLQDAVHERLFKLLLWNACATALGREEYELPLSEVALVAELDACKSDLEKVAQFVFTVWQQHGAMIFYSMGNTVDASHRDLAVGPELALPVSSGAPAHHGNGIRATLPQNLVEIIDLTDIDHRDDRPTRNDCVATPALADRREHLLKDFAADARKTFSDPHWLIQHAQNAAEADAGKVAEIHELAMTAILANNRAAYDLPGHEFNDAILRLSLGQLVTWIAEPTTGFIDATQTVIELGKAAIHGIKGAKTMLKYSTWRGFAKVEAEAKIAWASDAPSARDLAYDLRTIALPYRRNEPHYDLHAMGDLFP